MIDRGKTKSSGRWQRALIFSGILLVSFAAVFMVRIVWEETLLTLRDGPQMVGFSLAHGSWVFLLFAPILLALWFLMAFITMIGSLWRRRRLSKGLWLTLAAAAIVLGVVSLPEAFWQSMFIGSFAKSEHAADLMTYAAAEGDVRTVRGYLNHGVPLEGRNYEGSTATFTAAAGGSVQVLEMLASMGANLSAVNSFGDSPLAAARGNHHDAAAALLKAKGAVLIEGTPEQRQAASHAIVQRDIERMSHHQ
jgi:hypothetical protein